MAANESFLFYWFFRVSGFGEWGRYKGFAAKLILAAVEKTSQQWEQKHASRQRKHDQEWNPLGKSP